MASAAGAFASVGVEGAGSFSIVERAAMGCWGRAAMCCWGSYMVLGLQTWAREGAEPARKSRAGPPLAGDIPGRARGLGPRDIEAPAASVANGRALAEAASKPIERRGTRAGSFSGSVAFIHPPDARPLGPGQPIWPQLYRPWIRARGTCRRLLQKRTPSRRSDSAWPRSAPRSTPIYHQAQGPATASMTTTPRTTTLRRTPFLRNRRRLYQPSRR